MSDIGNVLASTIGALCKAARERAMQSDSNERLFEAYQHSGLEGLLRRCSNLMLEHALNTADLIREELGRSLTKEDWNLIQALPLVAREMENEIRETEGFSCCVDKSYQRLAKSIIGEGA